MVAYLIGLLMALALFLLLLNLTTFHKAQNLCIWTGLEMKMEVECN